MKTKGDHASKICVVVGTVTDDLRLYEVPPLKVCLPYVVYLEALVICMIYSEFDFGRYIFWRLESPAVGLMWQVVLTVPWVLNSLSGWFSLSRH